MLCLVGSVIWDGELDFKSYTINKIEAFEMWIYSQILKIPWTARITNKEVLRRIGGERKLLKIIIKKKRKLHTLAILCETQSTSYYN